MTCQVTGPRHKRNPITAPVVHLISHPLVQHKLTLMRSKDLSTSSFRRLLYEISMLMAYEVTRDMPMQMIEIETPLEKVQAPVIEGRKTVFVVVMRASNGLLDGMLEAVAGARETHGPVPMPFSRSESCPQGRNPDGPGGFPKIDLKIARSANDTTPLPSRS
jgi:Uracil phosphoribosyltransferase